MTFPTRIREAARPGLPLGPDTPLAEALDQVDRICSLPFWLEEATGRIPTDAELLSWHTLGDALRWAGLEWPEEQSV